MAEEAQSYHASSFGHGKGRLDIRVARLDVPDRVVVRERERASVEAKDSVQNVADRKPGPLKRTIGDEDTPNRAVRGVAYDREQPLTTQTPQLSLCDRCNVRWTSQADRKGGRCSATSEFERDGQ